MATITIYLIAAISIIQFLKETNNSCKQGYIISDRFDIHCEIQAVPFAEAIGYHNLDRGDWAERGI